MDGAVAERLAARARRLRIAVRVPWNTPQGRVPRRLRVWEGERLVLDARARSRVTALAVCAWTRRVACATRRVRGERGEPHVEGAQKGSRVASRRRVASAGARPMSSSVSCISRWATFGGWLPEEAPLAGTPRPKR